MIYRTSLGYPFCLCSHTESWHLWLQVIYMNRLFFLLWTLQFFHEGLSAPPEDNFSKNLSPLGFPSPLSIRATWPEPISSSPFCVTWSHLCGFESHMERESPRSYCSKLPSEQKASHLLRKGKTQRRDLAGQGKIKQLSTNRIKSPV